MPTELSPQFGASTRARDGLTVTAVELDSGRVESFARRGFVIGHRPERIVRGLLDVLREIAAELDGREGRWRVRTLSSPVSILHDLRLIDPEKGTYEAILLSKIGRLDLLERPVRSRRAAQRMSVQVRQRERGSRDGEGPG